MEIQLKVNSDVSKENGYVCTKGSCGITTYLAGETGAGGPWHMFTQPLKQHSPWLGQSVSLTPGLQQVLVWPPHSYAGFWDTTGHFGSALRPICNLKGDAPSRFWITWLWSSYKDHASQVI